MTEEEAIAWVDAMAEKYYTDPLNEPDPQEF
jgi:hypothetical protein